jgi:hypothetical protein
MSTSDRNENFEYVISKLREWEDIDQCKNARPGINDNLKTTKKCEYVYRLGQVRVKNVESQSHTRFIIFVICA